MSIRCPGDSSRFVLVLGFLIYLFARFCSWDSWLCSWCGERTVTSSRSRILSRTSLSLFFFLLAANPRSSKIGVIMAWALTSLSSVHLWQVLTVSIITFWLGRIESSLPLSSLQFLSLCFSDSDYYSSRFSGSLCTHGLLCMGVHNHKVFENKLFTKMLLVVDFVCIDLTILC